MPSNKRLSAAASLETLLEKYASQRAKKASSIASSPPLKPVGSRQLGDAKRGERQTITQVVENDPHLREIIQRLLELKFLLPGIVHPSAYLRDSDRIESAWRKSKSKANAVAMGVHLNNELFFEGINAVRQKVDFTVSPDLRANLADWEKEIEKLFPNESTAIRSVAHFVGLYLEFINRKAQGF
jgi:hypothetical protein